MNDNLVRHLVSLATTLVCLLAFVGGYMSADKGWWWVSFGLLIVYGGVYKIIDK